MTEDEKRELADVYERAANYIETNGWFGYNTPNEENIGTKTCMGVGIHKCVGKVSLHAALMFVRNALELEGEPCTAIYEWNDDPSRTKDEVINVLHGLANKLR